MAKIARSSVSGQFVIKGNAPATGKFVVRDSKSGRFLEVRGANSIVSKGLKLRKNIDLTKPIAKQALRNSSKPSKHATKG